MKTNRIIDHRQRIRRVATYIDDHLDDKLSLPTLAAVACLSPFHFQRVYQQLVGETPADTVRRLRLKRAAMQIGTGEMSVTEAATLAGYGSSQAFCRAFRRDFGVAPSRLKKAGREWLAERLPQRPSFSIVELPTRIGYGLRFGGADWDGDWSCCQIVARAFSNERWDPTASPMFMLYRADSLTSIEGPTDADICLISEQPIPDAPELDRVVLPGGTFAVLAMRRNLASAMPGGRRLMQAQMPEAGFVRRPGPVLRRCLNDPVITPPSERVFELYVPVVAGVSVDTSREAEPVEAGYRAYGGYAAAG